MTTVDWSVSVLRVGPGQACEQLHSESPGRILKTASVGKLLLLLHVSRLIERGALDPAEPLCRTELDSVADSGIWQYLRTDTLPVADLCELVGITSDNLATNVLLRRVGLAAVNATAAGAGLQVTALHDRVRDLRNAGNPPTLSSGSAAELAGLIAAMTTGAVTGGHRVLQWLGRGADLSQVAAGWGLDPLAHRDPDRGLVVANKTGTDCGIRAEVGVLTGPVATIAYAVLANWTDGPGTDSRRLVLDRQRQVGLLIADAARGADPAWESVPGC